MNDLAQRLKETDDALLTLQYNGIKYSKEQKQKFEKLWGEIRKDKKILELATEVVKTKFGDDIFKANAIVESILIDYTNVDKELYQKLVNKICSNADLAKIGLQSVLYGTAHYSFLLYVLFNDELELTEEQKEFIISEAMNRSQAHGLGAYDIRCYILKNHNFADKIEQLVFDFYANAEEYDDYLETWEWDIVNFCCPKEVPVIYIDEILYISPEEVYNRLPFEMASQVIKEIEFVKKLRKIRPMQWEVSNIPKRTLE